MKQYFTYDELPTDSPSPTCCPQALVTEPPSTENTTPDAVEVSQELKPLPDLMNSRQQKINGFQVINEDYQLDPTAQPNCLTIHHRDHQFDINTLPDCVTNHGKLQTAHSVEKKTPASNHPLSDHVITRGKQTIVVQAKYTILLTTMINRRRS